MHETYNLPDAAKAHLENGGRVFVVDEEHVITILRPDGTVYRSEYEGEPQRQSSRQDALEIAKGFANLSVDNPFVVGWDDET
jgi:uncharacterized lipoprotein YmbA